MQMNRRRGFTITELMVVIVLLGIVGGAIMNLLVKQQRFYRAENQVIANRSEIRQAAWTLPQDLLNAASSSKASDFKIANPDTLEFYATIGAGIICVKSSATLIKLPPATLASKAKFTDFLSLPVQNDGILVFNDSTNTNVSTDDTWQTDTISSIDSAAASTNCPSSTGYTQAADASQYSYAITLAHNLSTNIAVGSPVRIIRRVRYELKKNASDNTWYLYYNTCAFYSTTACKDNMQPVAGPFLANSGDAATAGVQFQYYDTTGTATTNLARIARVRMTVRGQTSQKVNLVGLGSNTVAYKKDTMYVDVAIRNR